MPPGDIVFLIIFDPYIGYLNRSAFSLRSMAVLVMRAKQAKVGEVGRATQVKLRGDWGRLGKLRR